MKIVCQSCKTNFEARRGAKTCSVACRKQLQRNQAALAQELAAAKRRAKRESSNAILKCQSCGTTFEGRRDALTCSTACRKRLQRTRKLLAKEIGNVRNEAKSAEQAIARGVERVVESVGQEVMHAENETGAIMADATAGPAPVNPVQSPVTTPSTAPTGVIASTPVETAVVPQTVVASGPATPVATPTVSAQQAAEPLVTSPNAAQPVDNQMASVAPVATPSSAPSSGALLNVEAPVSTADTSLEQAPTQVSTASSVVVGSPTAADASGKPVTAEAEMPKAPRPSLRSLIGVSHHPIAYGLIGLAVILIGAFGAFRSFGSKATSTSGTSVSSQTDQTLTTSKVGSLNINRNTTITGGYSLQSSGKATFQNQTNSAEAFAVQKASGQNLLVVDTKDGTVGVGGAPTGQEAFQVVGDAVASGTLAAAGGKTVLSAEGLTINGKLVCSANSCAGSSKVSAASLPSNVTLQGNSFNGPDKLVQLNGAGALPAISGANLTNVDAALFNGQAAAFYLDASNINSGTLSDSRLSSSVTLQGNSFNGASQLVQLNGSGALPAVSGANLTDLNGSNIASGTVADARLSTNVTLAGNTFNGASELVQLTGRFTADLEWFAVDQLECLNPSQRYCGRCSTIDQRHASR